MARKIKQVSGDFVEKGKLGKLITSWVYKPAKSNKFLYAALGVLGALVIFLVYYGKDLLPWVEKIPSVALYGLVFLISPVVKYLKSLGKDQEWGLYEYGFTVRTIRNEGETGSEEVGYWSDYKSCTYDEKGVKLIPDSPLKKSWRIRGSMNTTEIYSICRERISIESARKLDRSSQAPSAPRSREQKKMASMEKKSKRFEQKDTFDWKSIFEE